MGLIKQSSDELVCMRVTPNQSVPDEDELALAKAIAGLYKPLCKRISFSLSGISLEKVPCIAWETRLQSGIINNYIVCPRRLAELLKFKIHSVWKKAVVEKVSMPADFNEGITAACELRFKRQDIFSLNTKDGTGFTEMRLKTAHGLKGSERAVVQVLFEPINQEQWKQRARQLYWRFLWGTMMMPEQLEKNIFARSWIGLKIKELVWAVAGNTCQNVSTGTSRENGRTVQSRLVLLRKMSDPDKPGGLALRAFIRIVAEAADESEAARVVHAIALAYRQLNLDNELVCREHTLWKNSLVKDVNLRRPPLLRVNGNIMSMSECRKLMEIGDKRFLCVLGE